MCDTKLQFYSSYGDIDIWFSQNTKSGVTKYTFWFMGQTYERDSYEEIVNVAKECINRRLGRQK